MCKQEHDVAKQQHLLDKLKKHGCNARIYSWCTTARLPRQMDTLWWRAAARAADSSEHWETALRAAGVPVSTVRLPLELYDDEQISANIFLHRQDLGFSEHQVDSFVDAGITHDGLKYSEDN